MSMGCAVSRDALREHLPRTFAEFNVTAEIRGWLRLDNCRLILTWVAWCATFLLDREY
jgi:hypothetical protein